MQILTQTGGLFSTNCYLIADEQSKQAVLFDAPDHTVIPLVQEAKQRGYELIGLWLTHGHVDHIAEHPAVTAAFPQSKILLHQLDFPMLRNPNAMFPLPFTIPARDPDEFVEDGQKLKIGSLTVDVIHTPGHSPGHVMYHFPNENILIGGDLIICGTVGRTDLPLCNERHLIESIRKIMRLPGQTRILPGHCAESTLDDERQNNPFVRAVLGM